jgi:hypothetical protein
MNKVIEIQAFERLQHLFHWLLQGFYQGFIFNSQIRCFIQKKRFVTYPLAFLLHDIEENLRIIVFGFEFFGFDVNHLLESV